MTRGIGKIAIEIEGGKDRGRRGRVEEAKVKPGGGMVCDASFIV